MSRWWENGKSDEAKKDDKQKENKEWKMTTYLQIFHYFHLLTRNSDQMQMSENKILALTLNHKN